MLLLNGCGSTTEPAAASTPTHARQAVAVNPSDVGYTLVPDPAWPENSVVIIDTATGKVIESCAVDSASVPTH